MQMTKTISFHKNYTYPILFEHLLQISFINFSDIFFCFETNVKTYTGLGSILLMAFTFRGAV